MSKELCDKISDVTHELYSPSSFTDQKSKYRPFFLNLVHLLRPRRYTLCLTILEHDDGITTTGRSMHGLFVVILFNVLIKLKFTMIEWPTTSLNERKCDLTWSWWYLSSESIGHLSSNCHTAPGPISLTLIFAMITVTVRKLNVSADSTAAIASTK